VLVVHGGSWIEGDPYQINVEGVAERISQSGFWVFSPDYRLAPCGKIPGQPPHDGSPTPTPSGTPTPTPNPSGRPPEQTDDIVSAVRAARADSRCNGKVAIVAASSGGNISAFVALDRSAADRPDCIVTFSSPFDLSDQLSTDFYDFADYMQGVRNYIGTDNRDTARAASPISKIDSGTAADFRPMFMVQTDHDPICPYRQIFDMVCALDTYQVDPCQYVIKYVTDNHEHAFVLWNHQDPDWTTTHSIGESVLTFLHDHLD
jgi:acetyl esterase/lipase